MNTPTQTPLTDAEEYAKHVIAHLYPDHSNGARLVQIALNEWLNRHLATLHAQLGEARAELERVQTANNGDSSFPHFDSVVIPTEADADIKALGALLTPEGLGLYNRIARRNYDARRKLQLELNEAREALGHWMQRAEWAEKRESAQIARMKTREGELETLIQRMLDAARGSLDYSGGHRDKDLENFHHGIQTVIRVLEAVAKSDPGDTQVNALVRIGRSAALQSVAKEGETKSL